MTNRISSITVVLAHDTRDDDAERLLDAIRQFRGVASATPNISDITQHVADERARRALGDALWSVIYPHKG